MIDVALWPNERGEQKEAEGCELPSADTKGCNETQRNQVDDDDAGESHCPQRVSAPQVRSSRANAIASVVLGSQSALLRTPVPDEVCARRNPT